MSLAPLNIREFLTFCNVLVAYTRKSFKYFDIFFGKISYVLKCDQKMLTLLDLILCIVFISLLLYFFMWF